MRGGRRKRSRKAPFFVGKVCLVGGSFGVWGGHTCDFGEEGFGGHASESFDDSFGVFVEECGGAREAEVVHVFLVGSEDGFVGIGGDEGDGSGEGGVIAIVGGFGELFEGGGFIGGVEEEGGFVGRVFGEEGDGDPLDGEACVDVGCEGFVGSVAVSAVGVEENEDFVAIGGGTFRRCLCEEGGGGEGVEGFPCGVVVDFGAVGIGVFAGEVFAVSVEDIADKDDGVIGGGVGDDVLAGTFGECPACEASGGGEFSDGGVASGGEEFGEDGGGGDGGGVLRGGGFFSFLSVDEWGCCEGGEAQEEGRGEGEGFDCRHWWGFLVVKNL